MLHSVVIASICVGMATAVQPSGDKQQTQLEQGKNIAAIISEPAAAESNSYGTSQYGGFGGSLRSGNYYGGSAVDPRYYDRGDTPHFGLAGFPFGYERRYNGQNIVYDNSLQGFPLNYHNYRQQDYYGNNNNYNSYKPMSYRSAAYYAQPKTYGSSNAGSAGSNVEYGAYLNRPAQNANYHSLQYGY